ncbi:FAD-dependent oxidoreductase [Streptomyces sp. NBC_01233]|uniref:FAD-dependent oxidoreductase n=1 Tax=Streptomyces sp. NBC_01233 TaxID=2903787 RepID=UPI003FA35507
MGGGFTGVTAARELTMRGRSSVLVESRDPCARAAPRGSQRARHGPGCVLPVPPGPAG